MSEEITETTELKIVEVQSKPKPSQPSQPSQPKQPIVETIKEKEVQKIPEGHRFISTQPQKAVDPELKSQLQDALFNPPENLNR